MKLYIYVFKVPYGMYVGTAVASSREDADVYIEMHYQERYDPFGYSGNDYQMWLQSTWNIDDGYTEGECWIAGTRE